MCHFHALQVHWPYSLSLFAVLDKRASVLVAPTTHVMSSSSQSRWWWMMGDAGDGLMVIVDKGSFSILRYRGRIPGFGLWSVHISIYLFTWAKGKTRATGRGRTKQRHKQAINQSIRQARRDICAVRYFQSQSVNSLCNFVGHRSIGLQIWIHTMPCHTMPCPPFLHASSLQNQKGPSK